MKIEFKGGITCEIIEQIAVLGKGRVDESFQLELNLLSINGGEPVYDIREWNISHTRMSKGLKISKEQMGMLYQILKCRFENTSHQVSLFPVTK